MYDAAFTAVEARARQKRNQKRGWLSRWRPVAFGCANAQVRAWRLRVCDCLLPKNTTTSLKTRHDVVPW